MSIKIPHKFIKITEESVQITNLLNMVHRVNHDTDNSQHRLLTIQWPHDTVVNGGRSKEKREKRGEKRD